MPCGMRVCLDATSQQRNNGQEPTKIYRHHRQHVRRQASSIQNNTTPRLLCATSAGGLYQMLLDERLGFISVFDAFFFWKNKKQKLMPGYTRRIEANPSIRKTETIIPFNIQLDTLTATTGWRLLLFCLISFVGRMWVIGRFLNQVALSGIGTFCEAADYSYLWFGQMSCIPYIRQVFLQRWYGKSIHSRCVLTNDQKWQNCNE